MGLSTLPIHAPHITKNVTDQRSVVVLNIYHGNDRFVLFEFYQDININQVSQDIGNQVENTIKTLKTYHDDA